jgi:hypothetical protein
MLAAVLVIAGPRVGRAEAPGEAIAWQAPGGCPSADALRARVIEHLGRPLREGEVDARLEVARRGAAWRVVMTVQTEAGEGERALEAASCGELAESAALILALTIDPLAGTDPDELARAAAPPGEVADDEGTAASQVFDDEDPALPDRERAYLDLAPPTPAAPVEVHVRVRALVGGDLGSLPAPASAVGGAIEVAFGSWSADLGVQHFAAREARAPLEPRDPEPDGARVDLTSLVARACYAAGPTRWRAGGCAGGDLGIVTATGFGFDLPAPPHTTLGGGPQLGALWALRVGGPVAMRADVTATVQVVRTVVVDGEGMVLHDPNLLVWRGFVGVEASWR